MPTAVYEFPDGRVAEIEFDDQAQLEEAIASLESGRRLSQEVQPDTGGFGQQALAGAGKFFSDVGTAAGQLGARLVDPTGAAVSRLQSQVAETRQLERPLMETAGGQTGNIGAALLATAPAAFIPGAASIAGAAGIGGALGVLTPSASTGEGVANVSLGGALGGVGQKVGSALAGRAGQLLAQRQAGAASASQLNAVRDATLRRAQQAGYVVPPSTVNPTAANRVLESLSGKAATQQAAAAQNQQVTNRLIRQELGLPDDAPLTRDTLNTVRSKAGGVYKDIKASGTINTDKEYTDGLKDIMASIKEVSKDFPGADVGSNKEVRALVKTLTRQKFGANSAVEYIKQLRKMATGNLSGVNSADPAKRALGTAQREAAAILEEQVIRHLNANGKTQLAGQFDEARRLIAKTYSVEAALNDATGNVVARKLATQLGRRKPLSGGIREAAEFAQLAPRAAEEVTHSGGVSALDAMLGGGGVLAGQPLLLAAPFGRYAARQSILSRPYQARMTTPNYAPRTVDLQAAQLAGRGGRFAPVGLLGAEQEEPL